MLQHNHITRKKKLFHLAVRFDLSVVDYLPLVEVLRNVGIVSLKYLIRVLSSPWGPWSILRWLMNPHLLVKLEIFGDMYIGIVLLVV